MTEQPDRPPAGDAVPTRVGGWRPPARPLQQTDPKPDAPTAAAQPGPDPSPPARRARHRAERPRRFGRRDTPAEPRPEFDTLAPGWSGLADPPAESARPKPPTADSAEPTSPSAERRTPRSWLAEDDFAAALPFHQPAPGPPPAPRVRPDRRTDSAGSLDQDQPEFADEARGDDADLSDDTRLTAAELPWGVPARAAAGAGPLPPAELLPRRHNPLRVALAVAGCGLLAAALVVLIVLALTHR